MTKITRTDEKLLSETNYTQRVNLISSHTARKTILTNSLVLGINQMFVRNITGYKNETSFRRYVKIADDFKKQEMDTIWNKIDFN